MRIGILSARGDEYHPNQRLLKASRRLGHEATLIHPATCRPTLENGQIALGEQLAGFDTILPRIGATINDYALALVRQFELSGVDVVNGFEAITLARDKFLGLQKLVAARIPIPRTTLVSNIANLLEAADALGGYPVVAKSPRGRQGQGVFLLREPGQAAALVETLDARNRGLLVQEYIPLKNRLDLRLLVIGDRVTAALALTPRKGDFRANIHQASHASAIRPDAAIIDLALASARAMGLEIAGVDVIIDSRGDPRVIEANYSPGFRGLEAASGLDIAGEIIHYVRRKHARKIGELE